MNIVRLALAMASIWKSVGVVIRAKGKAPQKDGPRERNASGIKGD